MCKDKIRKTCMQECNYHCAAKYMWHGSVTRPLIATNNSSISYIKYYLALMHILRVTVFFTKIFVFYKSSFRFSNWVGTVVEKSGWLTNYSLHPLKNSKYDFLGDKLCLVMKSPNV